MACQLLQQVVPGALLIQPLHRLVKEGGEGKLRKLTSQTHQPLHTPTPWPTCAALHRHRTHQRTQLLRHPHSRCVGELGPGGILAGQDGPAGATTAVGTIRWGQGQVLGAGAGAGWKLFSRDDG